MRDGRERTASLAALLCLAASPACANWEYTSWGMTAAQVVRASHGAVHLIPGQRRLGQTGPDIETRAEGVFVEGRLRLHVSFGFRERDGGLALVSYLVEDAAQNYVLRARLVRTYGPPHASGDADLGSGIWRNPGQDVIDLSISDEGPGLCHAAPARQLARAPPHGVGGCPRLEISILSQPRNSPVIILR